MLLMVSDTDCANASRSPLSASASVVASRFSSGSLIESRAPDWAIWSRNCAQVSLTLLTTPPKVCICASEAPPAERPISAISALITSRPSSPADDISRNSMAFLPVTFASSSQTGTPWLISCRMSWPCRRCAAHAWPRARLIPCRDSCDPPNRADWSAMACRVPSIGSRPKFLSVWNALRTPSSSNGVSLAKVFTQANAASPLAASPNRLFNWIRARSKSPATFVNCPSRARRP